MSAPAERGRPSVAPLDLSEERVTFVQHQLPGLESSVYRLGIDQHLVAADGTTRLNTTAITRDYTFAVGGPRFVLPNPAETISSLFPADHATGDFHTVLPHVVLTSPTLPWTRSPKASQVAVGPTQGDIDSDVASWLAVLTLDGDDAAAFDGLRLDPAGATIGDLFPVAAVPGSSLPARTHSYFDDATDTDGLQPGETTDDPIQIIDLPLALLAEIAPALTDLALNSHVRQLSLQSKPTLLGAAPPSDPLGTYAIVIGNRLPQFRQTSHAYLVCLEGLSEFLPPSGPVDSMLRLAVLAHWTFVSQGNEIVDFTTTLAGLNGRRTGGKADGAVTTLRIARDDVSTSAAGAAIGAALNAGYAPLTHTVRTGETTASWYRGPLSPDGSPPPPGRPVPFSCADAALVFDPTTGLLDASLAAAWTVGRLIALQDKAFSTALYTWKQGLTETVVDTAERQILAEVLGEEQIADDPTGRPLLHATMRLLARGGTS